MRINTGRFLLTALTMLGAGATSVAVAAPPAAPAAAASTSVTTTAATPATPAPNAAAAAVTKPTTSATPDAVQAAEEKRLLAAGYKPEMRNGVKFWCRKEPELGSNLSGHKVCRTQDQIITNSRDTQESLDIAQRRQVNPTGK
jgi:hypothetical protein